MPKDSLSLAEAANELGFDNEKSIRRLIKAGKLDARKQVVDGKRRWVIHRVDINRYRLIEGGWLKRQMSSVPPLEGYEGRTGPMKVYGQSRNARGNADRWSTYPLEVSIEDFWDFACKPLSSEKEYDSIKAKIRSRLPEQPENFQIQYKFGEEVEDTLNRIVDSLPPLLISGEDSTVLKLEALEHLKLKALPSLHQAKRGWVSYLRQSVRNFYADRVRHFKRKAKETLLSDLADSANLENQLYAATRRKSKHAD
jgi:hypothetical protein